MYTIVNDKLDSFDVDSFDDTSNAIIFYNDEKKEQFFLPNAIRSDFEKKMEKANESGKPLSEHRFRIHLQYGKNANGKIYVTLKGIEILGKVKSVKRFDF